jgi:hypothetical protein
LDRSLSGANNVYEFRHNNYTVKSNLSQKKTKYLVNFNCLSLSGIYDIGGLRNVYEIVSYGNRLNFFDFNPDPFLRQNFWSLYLGGIVYISMSYW